MKIHIYQNSKHKPIVAVEGGRFDSPEEVADTYNRTVAGLNTKGGKKRESNNKEK